MNARKVVWLRRGTQVFFLLLFFWLLLAARAREEVPPTGAMQLFFNLDPLVLVATWLSAHAVPAGALLALVTVAATLVLGRVFCGWVCPLGALHNGISWLRKRVRRYRRATDSFSAWQRAKYYLLAALLVMALFGGHWIGVFDPFSLLYRSTTVVVYPGLQYAIEDGSTAVYQGDPHVGPLHLTAITEPVYRFFRDHVFSSERQVFRGSTLVFLVFVTALALNLYRRRFWCRYICPLGGLLGALARRPVMRLANTDKACTNCGRCAMRCPAAAQPEKPGAWLPTECFGCWNCVDACHVGAIKFTAGSPLRRPSEGKLDITKRALLASGIGGLGGLLMFRLTPQAQAKGFNPKLIRPPGAREEREFLKRCIQCGLCMKVCPTNALHPTLAEAGLEGVWTPRLIPQIGYCDYDCNLCGQVCPTGAIEAMPVEEKQQAKLGLATFDTTRCLPYAYGRDCIICAEHCPVAPKAIFFTEQKIRRRDGTTRVVKQPRVDPDLCIGCGICEWSCVFKDRPAVRVTSANETRHPNNQPILPGLSEPAYGETYGESENTEGSPYGDVSSY